MKNKPNILIYVPSEKTNLSDDQIRWIENFKTILSLSINQIVKSEVNTVIHWQKEPSDLLSQDCIVLFLSFVDENLSKYINDPILKNKETIYNVICDPIELSSINLKVKNILFFDEISHRMFDLVQERNSYSNIVWLKFLDLAFEISKNIKAQNKAEKKYKGYIYIAETSIDQNSNRDILVRELEHTEYKVLPDEKLSLDLDEFSKEVHENLAKCFLSIHIIGNEYAPLIKPIEVSGVEVQNDIFNEVISDKNNNIFRMVWLSPNLKPKSEKQKKYIENFKRNIELLKNTEIVQTPIEVFKSIIHKKIDSLQELKKDVKSEVINENKKVYLIYDDKDSELKNSIQKELLSNSIEILNTDYSGNKIDQVHNHYANLVNSDAIIISYTKDNIQWLNSKLSDIIKSPGFGKKNKFLAKFILYNIAHAPKINLHISDIDLVKSESAKLTDNMKSFIEKIK